MGNQRDGRERLARCCCGNLKVTARGEPVDVYLCSCIDCQRGTGSAFSYAAIFPVSAVSIAGERREYRQQGDSGRCVDSFSARLVARPFCSAPKACRELLVFRSAALPTRASLDHRSSSGPRNGITGSSFLQASL